MTDDGRITDKAEYGRHINLYCVCHPEKRWSTKNIYPIGCRTIFYNLEMDADMGEECSCSISELRVK